MELRTIIVEDEPLGQEALEGILQSYCKKSIRLIDTVATVDEAIHSIRTHDPDLVFMDIKLCGNEHGAFDILQSINDIRFKVVFTTSSDHSENILKAINEYGARKYLLKPLDIDEVVQSVETIREEIKNASLENEIAKIKKLLNAFPQEEKTTIKINIPIRKGFQCVAYDEIIMIRSDLNNTLFFLENGEILKSSKNLRFFEKELPKSKYCRVARSHIINLDHLIRFSREDGGTIFMSNNCTAPLSDKYSNDFYKRTKF